MPLLQAETEETKRAPARWEPSPYALIRFAGKSFAELDQLKFERTVPLVKELTALRQWIDEEKMSLCDETLYGAIGGADGEQRSALVALKRDLFNERRISSEQLRLLRQPTLRYLRLPVLRFLWRVRRYARLDRIGRALFEAEMAEKRAFLKASFADEEFLKALQIASPALFASLRTYQRSDPAQLRARERRIEDGALRYFLRMTAKTSPFSRFGPVALAGVDLDTAAPLTMKMPAGLRQTSQTNFNLAVVSQIAHSLARSPDIYPKLRPFLNPSTYLKEDQIYFTRPISVREQRLTESMSTLRKGPYIPPIRHVVEALQQSRNGSPTLRGFEEELARGVLGARARPFLQKLIDSGLVLNEFQLPSNTRSRLLDLHDALTHIDSECAMWAVNHLRALGEAVDRFAEAPVGERGRLMRETQRLVDELMRWWVPESMYKAKRTDHIIEDAIVGEVQATLGANFFEPFLQELTVFLNCIHARDQRGLSNAMLRDVFTAQFGEGGRCTNIADFATDYLRMVIQSNLTDERLWPRASALNRNALRYLETLGIQQIEAADERFIPTEHLDALTMQFQPTSNEPRSVALNLQVAASDWEALARGDYLVVLNYALPGFGHFYSRYCYLFDQVENTVPLHAHITERIRQLEHCWPRESEMVELLSVLDHNAQVHPCFTERQIVPPGEISQKAKAAQIPTEQLELVHDPASDQLLLFERCDREPVAEKRELTPLYMGFFHNMALPSLHRVLTDMAPTGYHMERLKPAEHDEGLLPYQPDHPAYEQAVRHYPRLRVGKFVFQRELWAFDPAALPNFAQDDEFALFCAAYQWKLQHELPTELFVRIKRDRLEADLDFQNDHKPMYFDFENFFTIKVLRHLLDVDHIQAVQVEEMLPNPRQLFFECEDERYAVEFQIEFNQEAYGD